MTQAQFQEYIESYAEHYNLLKDIVFKASVQRATRNEDDTKWRLEYLINGQPQVAEFDKAVFCHGYQTKARMPEFEGGEKYERILIHAQEFRTADEFKDKKVIIVGMSSTGSDIVNALLPVTSKIYVSHRRGRHIVGTFRNGTPADLIVTWRRRQIAAFLQRRLPNFHKWAADTGLAFLCRQVWGKPDPEWRLEPAPSPLLSLPAASDTLIPQLKSGQIASLQGIKQFTGPRSLELNDGTVIDDVDAVICATGYKADFTVAPFIETSKPPNYEGPELTRLWMNMFPPQYADSMALVCHSAFGKNNGFSFNDVTSMAVSNIFRHVHALPSPAIMNADIDAHHEWLAGRWRLDEIFDPSAVKTWQFQAFLHEAAGTGMENLGWGWKGWKFWFKDPKMSWLMNNGVETAHAFRFFETGKRRTWDGAREAIIHMNEVVKSEFPLKETEKQK